MPMKWDSKRDQKLLMKILEAHPTLAVDVAKVAEIWPEADDSDRPTPRAIRERLGTIRKQAGITTPIRTTGSSIKLQEITYLQAQAQDMSSTQTTTRVKSEFDDADMPAAQTPPRKKLNFIRSSFSTPFRTTEKQNKNNGGTNKRKRRLDDTSDEEEAMSTSGSESEADAVPEKEPSTRSSRRLRTTKPNYSLKDVQTSTDDENQGSDDSDGGYNPVLEYETDKAKREKRGRAHKAGRLGEEDADAEEA